MDLVQDRARRGRHRISELPDELLGHIGGLLSTKGVASMSVLSRKFRHVFLLITSFDFDDSPMSHCLNHCHLIERYPAYKMFVDSVLQASQSTQDLTKFRLRIGRDETRCTLPMHRIHRCALDCFPELSPTQLKSWICFPLTRNVRELDLSIHARKPYGKLPPEIFTCQTLEVLKLDVRLDIDEMRPSFCLPNLKLLYLSAIIIPNEDFVTRLVSSCPLLEDLTLRYCLWEKEDYITISSPSLRRLELNLMENTGCFKYHQLNSTGVVLINTPNLQHLSYSDNLAWEYTVTSMNALITADIHIVYTILNGYPEDSFQSILNLVRSVSNVQCLSLGESCMEALDFGQLKNQLPMFHKLNYLELGYNYKTKWDQVLLEFLNCSPCLETLAFPEGLANSFTFADLGEPEDTHDVDLELLCWSTTQTIPSCFGSHLKKIVIKRYYGIERELELVKFLLRNASVLEELILYWNSEVQPEVDPMSHERLLKNLPRASITCSIRVQIHDPTKFKWVVSHPMVPTPLPLG